MQIFVESGVTCGIEFECDVITAENIFNDPDIENEWHPTHDASIETDTVSYGNLIAEPEKHCKFLPNRRITIGTELVSNILNSEDEKFFDKIDRLTSFLQNYGESSQSERSGIHFHISLPSPNLRTMKNILRLGMHYEKLFFRVGGMGYPQRGIKNDCTYAKPLTLFGPPCVKVNGGGFGQIYSMEKVLEAKTQTDFWFYFGDIPQQDKRYTPIRYMWLNIYPLYPGREQKGTVEFRIFNKSLNPEFIFSAFIMCKKFLELATKLSLDEIKNAELSIINSVYSSETQSDEFLLRQLSEMTNLDYREYKILDLILERTPEVTLKPEYIFSHLSGRMERTFWSNSKYIPPTIPSAEIRKPKYVDIHVLRGEN